MPQPTNTSPQAGRRAGVPQSRDPRRWTDHIATILAGVALLLGLAGCSGTAGDPAEAPTLEVTSAAPTLSLGQAVSDASQTVLALRQQTVDLYASNDPQIDELDDLASGEYLTAEKQAIKRNLAAGWTSNGGRVELVWARPQDSDLEGEPLKLVLYTCIDSTAVKGTDGSGGTAKGTREAVDYWLTGSGKADGTIHWRVADMTLHEGSTAADPC